jgi:hypothetical protein
MEIFRMIKVEYEDPINYYSKTKDWAMQMDEIEELVTTKLRSKYNDDSRQARIYQTPAGKTGSNIGSVIKRGRQRKESPWTCSKCYTIHKEKGYGCVNCGFALVKGKVAKKEKLDLANEAIRQLPDLVQDLIKDKVMADYIEALVTDRVSALLASKPSAPPKYMPLWPDLNAIAPPEQQTVRIEKHCAQELRVNGCEEWKEDLKCTPYAKIERVDGKDVLYQQRMEFDPERSEREGCLCGSLRKVPLANVEVISKSAKRRQRAKENKMKETQVPLNSKAPAQTGATTTSGANQRRSLANQSRSDKVASACTEQASSQKVHDGRPSSSSTQSTQRMDGPTGAPKQKRSASSCNATNTSQTSGSQPPKK